MNWFVIILLILGVLLVLIPILVYATTRKSEWYIWFLVALGGLFLITAFIIWLIEESIKGTEDAAKAAGEGVDYVGKKLEPVGKDVGKVAGDVAPIAGVAGAALLL